MKKTVLCILATVTVMLALCMPVFAQGSANLSSDFACNYSAQAKDGYYLNYGASSVTTLTAEQASDRDVPKGYTNDVLLVEHNNTSMGLLLDFSHLKLPYRLIESMTFRVYVCDDGLSTDDYPEVRIIKPGSGSWVMRYNVKDKTDRWVDVTLNADGTNFQSGRGFVDLAVDGFLDRFELSVRANQGEKYYYIDSISYTLKSDTTPPEMRYSGENVLYFPTDAKIELPISSYDAEEDRELEVQYTWSDPDALRSDGTLNKGCYTLTATATNFTGLSSTLTFTVVVGDADTTPPTIALDATEMHLPIGTVPMLSPVATDDTGYVKLVSYWSQDALDLAGKLKAGIHLYTVRATDLSGNEAVKTVIVYVSNEETMGDYVIDEQNGVIIDNRPSAESGAANGNDVPGDTPPSNENTGDMPSNESNEEESRAFRGFLPGFLFGICLTILLCWRLFGLDFSGFKKKQK